MRYPVLLASYLALGGLIGCGEAADDAPLLLITPADGGELDGSTADLGGGADAAIDDAEPDAEADAQPDAAPACEHACFGDSERGHALCLGPHHGVLRDDQACDVDEFCCELTNSPPEIGGVLVENRFRRDAQGRIVEAYAAIRVNATDADDDPLEFGGRPDGINQFGGYTVEGNVVTVRRWIVRGQPGGGRFVLRVRERAFEPFGYGAGWVERAIMLPGPTSN